MERKKYYITTAIAYTSGKPHIGNTYEIVLADSIARYKRQKGYDVYFQTGTDEHGEKIELKAKEKGITPKEFVDSGCINSGLDSIYFTNLSWYLDSLKKYASSFFSQTSLPQSGHFPSTNWLSVQNDSQGVQ